MKHRSLGLLVALTLGGCSAVKDTKVAEEGVASFHQAMDAGQYGPIYDASSNDMKSSITRQKFIALMGGLHAKLGSYRSGKTVGWNDNVNTSGHFVTLNRSVQFERGPGTEEFVFRIKNGSAVLGGYHVNSDLLITS